MTTESGGERRRCPRWVLPGNVQCGLHLRSRVRLVDISATGTLAVADQALPVGLRGQLTSSIGASFSSQVEVRRVGTAPQREQVALGMIFVAMDERSRRSLEEFLKKASA